MTPSNGRRSKSVASIFVAAPVLSSVVLGKLSVPPFSSMGLGMGLPTILAVTMFGCLAGAFRFQSTRLAIYLLMVAWACISQLFGKAFSLGSLCMLAAVFFPYTLQLRRLDEKRGDQEAFTRIDAQSYFTGLGYAVAVIGCAQFVLQQFLGPVVAFPIDHLLPKGLIIERYNYLNPLHYGSPIYKANGVFFLEPSFFSQFLAVSLLVELCGRQRLHRVLAHLLGLACAFSGTGLVVLASGGIALLLVRRQKALLGIGLLVAMLAFALGDLLRLNIFLDRVSEFSNVGTSGFERFVAWTYMLQDQFWGQASTVWTGFGAGTFFEQQQIARYSVMETPFAKLIFEYGIPGAVLYFGFIIYCIVATRAPAPIKVGLAVCMLMNGSYSESNTGILLTLILWPAPSKQDEGERGRHDSSCPIHPKEAQSLPVNA